MQLDGRVVLVTGGARRIGRAIAERLARAGCSIALHYRNAAADAGNVVAVCGDGGATAASFCADLADPEACQALVREVIARCGRLDVIVNNAAIFERMPIDEFDPSAWNRTLAVNLTAPLALVHAGRDELRRRRGCVVNLSDAATSRAWPDHLAYIVSKGALDTLTRVLARALAPEVNVVGIAPGVAAWPDDYSDERRAQLTAKIPLGRAGSAEEIAAAVEFVLRDGDYISGATLPIDGGRHV